MGRVVQSVQRAFELLEYVATSSDGARLSELADSLGLNRSTAHNLLASLDALGYVEQADKGTPYRLTGRLANLLGPRVEAEMALRARIRPVLEQITRDTGETSYLSFPTGEDYLCADAVQSPEPLHLTVNPGEREPLLGTAIGHALLASNSELATHIRKVNAEGWARHADAIAEAQTQGYALDLDGFHPGVSCVAVAVGSSGLVAIAGPTSRLPRERLVDFAEHIRQLLTAAM